MKINKLWRNWPVHNIIGHPACEIARIFLSAIGSENADKVAAKIHNATVPEDH